MKARLHVEFGSIQVAPWSGGRFRRFTRPASFPPLQSQTERLHRVAPAMHVGVQRTSQIAVWVSVGRCPF